jgi:glycosyltransferase involved in cell wall biosynthesis
MIGLTWPWRYHRALVDRAGLLWPFSNRAGVKKVLFVSAHDTICYAQIFPFFLYSRDFKNKYQIEMRELPLRRFFKGRHPYDVAVDAVCFQTWFDLTPEQLRSLTRCIKFEWPDAQIAYFDWFAPVDLRYADVLNPLVAAYVKKQTFKDFRNYGNVTLGDTNLTDFYAKRFQIDLPETRFSIPAGFHQKLVLGSGFEYSPDILRLLSRPLTLAQRNIDLHARIATQGTEWYTQMRREAQAMAVDLECRFRVAHRGRVSRREYFAELRDSKLCFSPFGYGEVCWRDFEAICTGALVLKPDMSHLRLANDIFKPYETYIPLAWDFSDLAQKVEYYVHNPLERQAIARNAFEVLSQHYRQKRFLTDMAPLWQLLRIN